MRSKIIDCLTDLNLKFVRSQPFILFHKHTHKHMAKRITMFMLLNSTSSLELAVMIVFKFLSKY